MREQRADRFKQAVPLRVGVHCGRGGQIGHTAQKLRDERADLSASADSCQMCAQFRFGTHAHEPLQCLNKGLIGNEDFLVTAAGKNRRRPRSSGAREFHSEARLAYAWFAGKEDQLPPPTRRIQPHLF